MKPDVSTDVVVVGGGGSGLAAAVAAAQAGAGVAVLEKASKPGGTTMLSIGSFTASGTSYQRSARIQDCPEWHFEDIPKFQSQFEGRCDLGLRRLLTAEAGKTLEWLEDLGVPFLGPFLENPHRVPRMHNVIPSARTYISILRNVAKRLGVSILVNTRAVRLVKSNGRVIGVAAENSRSKERLMLNARHGVILATGDFSASPELTREFGNPDLVNIDPINPLSTGDGHRMAIEIGAAMKNMDVIHTSYDKPGAEIRFVPPPKDVLVNFVPDSKLFLKFLARVLPTMPRRFIVEIIKIVLTVHSAPSPVLYKEGAILVNKQGRRFTDETKERAMDLAEQPDKIAFILFDAKLAEKFRGFPYFISTFPGVAYAYLDDYQRSRKDIFFTSDTLDGVANKAGIDAGGLFETIDRYNRFVRSQNDLDFGKKVLPCEIETPPFFVLGPIKAWVLLTEGGVAIDTKCQALDKDGRVILGLYAAGSAGQGGLILPGHGHHIAWALTSGRIAGTNAAQKTATS